MATRIADGLQGWDTAPEDYTYIYDELRGPDLGMMAADANLKTWQDVLNLVNSASPPKLIRNDYLWDSDTYVPVYDYSDAGIVPGVGRINPQYVNADNYGDGQVQPDGSIFGNPGIKVGDLESLILNGYYGKDMAQVLTPGPDGSIARKETFTGGDVNPLVALAVMLAAPYAMGAMGGAGTAAAGAAEAGAAGAAAAGTSAAELAAAGFGTGGMGLTGAGGIGAASSLAEAGLAGWGAGAAGAAGAGLAALPSGGMTATGTAAPWTATGEAALGSGMTSVGVPSIAPELLGTGLAGSITPAAAIPGMTYGLGGSIMAGAPGTLSSASGLGSAATNFVNTGTGLTPITSPSTVAPTQTPTAPEATTPPETPTPTDASPTTTPATPPATSATPGVGQVASTVGNLLNSPLGAAAAGALLGGSGGSQQSGFTTTTQDPWSALQPYLRDLYSNAQSTYNANKNPTEAEQQALAAIQARATAGSPLQAAAKTNIQNLLGQDPTQAYGIGMANDYLGQTVDPISNEYLGQLTPDAINEYLGRTVSPISNEYIGRTTQGATNNMLGRTVAPISNQYIGRTSPTANNSYIGRTTSVDNNPMLGLNNPYLQRAISNAQENVIRQMQPQFAAAQRTSGSFGNSGLQEMYARELPKQLGIIDTNMRMADYGSQQQLQEAAVARALQARQADLARNSALEQQQGQFNVGISQSDLARNAALMAQQGQFNAGLQQADITRDANLTQDLSKYNAGLSQADIARNAALMAQQGQFNAGLSQADLARNSQLAQDLGKYNAQLKQQDIARNAQLAAEQARFNAQLRQQDIARNAQLSQQGIQNNIGQYNNMLGLQTDAAFKAPGLAATDYTDPQMAYNTARSAREANFTPLNQYQSAISGNPGSSTTSPYFTNPTANILGGATAGLGLWNAANKSGLLGGGTSGTNNSWLGNNADWMNQNGFTPAQLGASF